MVLFYTSPNAKVYLTTEHSILTKGIPVVVVDGYAYGPGNVLPSGFFAGDVVRRFQNDDDPGIGRWHRSKEALRIAELFLAPCRGPLKAGTVPDADKKGADMQNIYMVYHRERVKKNDDWETTKNFNKTFIDNLEEARIVYNFELWLLKQNVKIDESTRHDVILYQAFPDESGYIRQYPARGYKVIEHESFGSNEDQPIPALQAQQEAS